MAGLYLIIGNRDNSRLQVAAKQLQFFDEKIQIIDETGFGCSWVSQNNPDLFGPALDPQTGVRIICSGRIAWDEQKWQQAASLGQYQGGLSSRLLLESYLQSGIEGIENSLNGAAATIVWDPRQQQIHLFTDFFGYYPIFVYQPEQVDGCVIASFPDAIADDCAVKTSWDYISMAEFLWQSKITPPHTYYQEIKYPGAATHCQWDLKQQTYQSREYLQPFQAGFFDNLSQAVEQTSAAISHSIHIRTLPRLQPIVSYTSGGLDSRVILFSSADRSHLSGLNLYDSPNRESEAAGQLCQKAGVDYVGFKRDEDYYPQWLKLGAKYSGGMWSAFDNHFLGTRELVCEKLAANTVLSACSTDFLFKDANLDRRNSRFLGKQLPAAELSPQWNGGFLDPPLMSSYRSVSPALQASIQQRLTEWFGDIPLDFRSELDNLRVEDKRNRPQCYAGGLSFPLLFSCFPYDSFMADQAIAQCYSKIPAKWKVNSVLWGLVSAKISGRDVIDANFGGLPGDSKCKKLFKSAINKIKRGWRSLPTTTMDPEQLAIEGSWPNRGWYITHSPTVRQLWETTSVSARQQITELLGNNPWEVPLEQWAKPTNSRYFFNILTLLSHWAERQQSFDR